MMNRICDEAFPEKKKKKTAKFDFPWLEKGVLCVTLALSRESSSPAAERAQNPGVCQIGPGAQTWLAHEGGAGVPPTPAWFYKEAVIQEAPSRAHRTRRAVTTVPLAA